MNNNFKNLILSNKLIYFFYKFLKILKNKKKGWYVAEFAEDVLTDRYLNKIKNGFYIDVGSYHPYKGSLTLKLFKKGWSGINIDLSKVSIDLFNISRPKDINICCAISEKEKEIEFFENSKINQQNTIIIKGKNMNNFKKIKSFHLNTILKKNEISDFDYLNIDVEGAEIGVLKSLDLTKYKPKLITLEINNFSEALNLNNKINFYLSKYDYILFNRVGVTNFYFKRKFLKKIHNIIKID